MTNEELLQLKQLLDEQKAGIIAEMDRKLATQKQEIIQQCTANMNVLIESMIQPQMNLLAENMNGMKAEMATQKDLDDLEIAIDDHFDNLEMLVAGHGNEIAMLKAQ